MKALGHLDEAGEAFGDGVQDLGGVGVEGVQFGLGAGGDEVCTVGKDGVNLFKEALALFGQVSVFGDAVVGGTATGPDPFVGGFDAAFEPGGGGGWRFVEAGEDFGANEDGFKIGDDFVAEVGEEFGHELGGGAAPEGLQVIEELRPGEGGCGVGWHMGVPAP